jgi:hypothetical protein
MSLAANKALVRRFFAALSHDGDLTALDDICVPIYAHRIGGEPFGLAWLGDWWRTTCAGNAATSKSSRRSAAFLRASRSTLLSARAR